MPDFFRIYMLILAALLGACMGSFLNCFAWRIVHGESVWKGRSHCDACNHVLGVRDLFPVISFLAAKGKCRYCGKKLSSRLVWSEIISALVFVSIVWRFGMTAQTAEYLLLACALLGCTFADLEDFLIPDRFIVFAIVVRLVFIFCSQSPMATLKTALIGGFSISLALLIMVLVMEKILKKDAMGGGDLKLLFVIGMYLGWERNFLCLMLSCFFGVFFGVISMKKAQNQNDETSGQFPWGPSITIAAWLVALWGSEFIAWYLGLFAL